MDIITPNESGLGPELTAHYTMLGKLPDGSVCGVHKLMFHWTMHIGLDDIGYADRYCFATEQLAQMAMILWNGDGDPQLWHKHPMTGRCRDPVTGMIWSEDEPAPVGRS